MTRSPPPQRVPTLTEVVALPEPAVASADGQAAEHADDAATAARPPLPLFDAALRAEIERLVDERLHGALDAAWQQILPTLLDATRRELASSLRGAIESAVAERMSGHRKEV